MESELIKIQINIDTRPDNKILDLGINGKYFQLIQDKQKLKELLHQILILFEKEGLTTFLIERLIKED